VEVVDERGRRDFGGRSRLTDFWWVEDLYGRFWVEGVAVVRALGRGGRDGRYCETGTGTGRHLFYAEMLGG
jgi:hypothetical protein